MGILDAGRLTSERLARILGDVEGMTELVCHPGIGDTGAGGRLRLGVRLGAGDGGALRSGDQKGAVGRGVEVSGFSGLERDRP